MISDPQDSGADQLDSRIDRALVKYVFVWIWSILFGTATGAVLTFANLRPYGRFRSAEVLIGVLLAVGGLLSLMSVYDLLKLLLRVILPMFSLPSSAQLGPQGSKLLYRATRNLVLSFGVALFAVFAQYVLGGLGD
jgi:hypothetical protein